MLEFVDKRSLWQRVLSKTQEEFDFDAYTMLQNQAYLDSIERSMAIIGVKSWNWIQTLERKRVHFLLQSSFTELMKHPSQKWIGERVSKLGANKAPKSRFRCVIWRGSFKGP